MKIVKCKDHDGFTFSYVDDKCPKCNRESTLIIMSSRTNGKTDRLSIKCFVCEYKKVGMFLNG